MENSQKLPRNQKLAEEFRRLGALFMEINSNKSALITVTEANVSKDLKRSTIFFTVLPETKEAEAKAFAGRQGGAFRKFVASHLKLRMLPYFSFEIDMGEKIRQKIDGLSKQG